MKIIAITEPMLRNIIKEAIEMGETMKSIELNVLTPYLSANKAYKLYKKATVKKWVDSGIIKEDRDLNTSKTSPIRYSVIELKSAAFSSNLIKSLSEKDKEEVIQAYAEL